MPAFSPSKDSQSIFSIDGDDLRECTQFYVRPSEKSQLSLLSDACDTIRLPAVQCQPDNDLSMMMMIDGLPDLQTGTSLKN